MECSFPLTVADVLRRKHFENAIVVAGKKGLSRTVKWVHVVEVTKINNLLRGKELILSTGVGWREDASLFLSLLRQLIECDASGLCIELGTYTSSIPEEAVELANQHHFPLIVFLEEVPFVEITHDIHTHLINQQYQMISQLESYSQQLNKKLLTVHDHREILTCLHDCLGHQVAFKMQGGDVEYIPCRPRQKREASICSGNSGWPVDAVVKPISLFDAEYAELALLPDGRDVNEFDLLILDRTATAWAQHLLRNLYAEEKRRTEENEWLKGWLEGEYSDQEISSFLLDHHPSLDSRRGVVWVCKVERAHQKGNFDSTYFKLLCRSLFEQRGFFLFSVEIGRQLAFIALDWRGESTWKKRVEDGIESIMASDFVRTRLSSLSMGVGTFVNSLSAMNQSYRAALEALKIRKRLKDQAVSLFYDDLHLYRMIMVLDKYSNLRETVRQYLGPIIEYDRKYNGKLLETLKVYLQCNGSKQETAKRLFIVRQTLYHRIEKLESFLGPDFMVADKRLAIELMIKAYDYLMDEGGISYGQRNAQRWAD
ncbi:MULTISPECIES: PucR family transcriptional regulator [Geobacillus]|uniref:PucR family transcriptional regulator n=1 Tax=Geobacillus thermopakistaniensis (strain MAS1) TaxID=1408282 RepID=A0A7U9P512_GEOTM|nr:MULTISPECIES: PucR family transcriptional regulator [Geobacillus]AOL34256.1 PucR family transcriptional regulator [Geobacillus thermoleovorans]ESU70860.1 PucR family transcriptional regulator [Geobacillus sp. MAS1]MBW7642235.1 PucR family transcriptional regulator ligand-binding domain-containing protein [Geobacillus thermoleovorans]